MKPLFILIFLINISLFCQSFEVVGIPELFAPDIVCIEKSEVKITFSKDGKIVLWGAVGREKGMGGLDIWEAAYSDSGWSNPQPVSFNSADDDFDPSFSADGKLLYFFSNRQGGEGGTDIYFVKYDSLNQSFSQPLNMGNKINTSGDEWGPAESIDGKKFIFCTDGLGGKGKHDIFICEKVKDGWSEPKEITEINSDEDDFDPAFLNDCKTILFTKKYSEDEAYLFISYLSKDRYTKPEKLGKDINISNTWNFGSSLDPINHSYFYYSTHKEENSKGRLDIYKVKYVLSGTE